MLEAAVVDPKPSSGVRICCDAQWLFTAPQFEQRLR
jgi:hypothetical protein